MSANARGRKTASQVWNDLSPEQREAPFGWVLGSYAPSVHAARFPLLKSETMTRATNLISENWKGAAR